MSQIPKGQAQSSTPKRFRADIEGLRAIAVLAVVTNHLLGFPEGGFIGVDVFYVISGFLITGLLIREFAMTGSISFSRFYARRIRRILPVALLVLVVTSLVSSLIWYEARAQQTFLDALWSGLFVANWHFAAAGTDYLQADGPVSPLQHYWSLSLEEQFYVLWPWLVVIPLAIVNRRRIKSSFTSRALLITFSAVAILSFAWSSIVSIDNANVAYFDTVGRAWELAVGGVLAVLGPLTARLASRTRTVLGTIGLAGIFASAFAISPTMPFPMPFAILPVFATALVIAARAENVFTSVLLTNPVSRYIGRISFSLYLWHFPVIIFADSLPFPNTATRLIASLVVMSALSALSFHFVEEPIRSSRWLDSWGESTRASRGLAVSGLFSAPRRKELLSTAAIGVTLALLVALQIVGPDYLQSAAALKAKTTNSTLSTNGASTEPLTTSEISSAIAESIALTDWPAGTERQLDQLDDSMQAPAMSTSTGCRMSVATTNLKLCEYGEADAPKTVLVIGDSVALSWLPSIESALPEAEWKIVGAGYASCSPSSVEALDSTGKVSFISACAGARERLFDLADTLQPSLVIFSSAQSAFARLASGSTGTQAEDEWRIGTELTIDRLSESSDEVVVISNPPVGEDARACVGRFTGPDLCEANIDPDYSSKASAELAAVQYAVDEGANASFIDTRSWFCSSHGECPLVIDETIVRTDTSHVTAAYARRLGEVLSSALAGQDSVD
jgi:peptidoglycan/LPS O-acetylase OafA/YrhL